jgi:hypothetical protein
LENFGRALTEMNKVSTEPSKYLTGNDTSENKTSFKSKASLPIAMASTADLCTKKPIS